MSFDQVLEDYPNLARAQIDAAVRFAEATPAIPGAFPIRAAKSVLRNGGGGGLAEAFATKSEDEEGE